MMRCNAQGVFYTGFDGGSPNFDPIFDPFFGSSPKVVRFCPKKLQNVTFDPVFAKIVFQGLGKFFLRFAPKRLGGWA